MEWLETRSKIAPYKPTPALTSLDWGSLCLTAWRFPRSSPKGVNAGFGKYMFGKIFRQIYGSTIADDYLTRLVFIDLIILADSDGIVDLTPESIAATTRVPLDIVNKALTELTNPDPRSRTADMDGRRLVLIDEKRGWGWHIVNYQKYRGIRDENDRKSYMRKYMQEYRKKNGLPDVNSVNSCKPPLAKGEGEGEGEGSVGAARNASVTPCNARPLQTEGRPTLKEVLEYALSVHCGVAEWKAKDWFDEMEGCGWLDYNRRPVQDWKAILRRVKTKWVADGRPSGPPVRLQANGKPVPPAEKSLMEKIAEQHLREAMRD